ncbi:DUF305 domain-containing protein [Solirubrobacter phytolaccae]|uniref:DUF305 domain-containing protein n=1 Tax=Solirubrobacter phytolaccae TaxID=1404360 RepID=A0A9X3N779_9ACTN|nr:DUF305 domain-containing protein [Solirubrobacter phytolaccae]MDA0179572.1 DUF305 domain-containing protein [Solirubrobacter phytolaccae]
MAIAAVLVGCGGSKQDDPAAPDAAAPAEQTATADPNVNYVQPGAPGEPSRKATPVPTPKGGGFVPADVEFMQKMIAHHDQALVMTALVPRQGSNTSVRLMAKRMEVSQTDEVEFMKRWLKARNFGTEPDHAGHSGMPGMLTDEQLAELKAAKGKRFDQLFLRYMTQHHQGALVMVQELISEGGASESEINQFVGHVDSDQSIEIGRMAELSKKL